MGLACALRSSQRQMSCSCQLAQTPVSYEVPGLRSLEERVAMDEEEALSCPMCEGMCPASASGGQRGQRGPRGSNAPLCHKASRRKDSSVNAASLWIVSPRGHGRRQVAPLPDQRPLRLHCPKIQGGQCSSCSLDQNGLFSPHCFLFFLF